MSFFWPFALYYIPFTLLFFYISRLLILFKHPYCTDRKSDNHLNPKKKQHSQWKTYITKTLEILYNLITDHSGQKSLYTMYHIYIYIQSQIQSPKRGSGLTRKIGCHELNLEDVDAKATACAHTLSLAFTSLGSSPKSHNNLKLIVGLIPQILDKFSLISSDINNIPNQLAMKHRHKHEHLTRTRRYQF